MPGRADSRYRLTVSLAAGLVTVGPLPAASQQLTSTVLVAETGEPVQRAFVSLLTADSDRPIAWAVSDSLGRFTLDARMPGMPLRVRIERIDFGTWTSRPIEVLPDTGELDPLIIPVPAASWAALSASTRQQCTAEGESLEGGSVGDDPARILGRVRYGSSGEPASDAIVWLEGASDQLGGSVQTSANGTFLLCFGPEDAVVSLQAAAKGSVGQRAHFRLGQGKFYATELALATSETAADGGGGRGGLLRGTVRSAATGEPVIGARVRVLDTGAEDLTGPDGTFLIAGLPKGQHRIATEHLGSVSDTVSFALGDEPVSVAVLTLDTRPVQLPTLEVEIERTRPRRVQGFYQRLEKGIGDFITREDLEHLDVVANFRRIPGVVVTRCSPPAPSSCWLLDLERGVSLGTSACLPVVWVDGHLWTHQAPGFESGFNNSFTLLSQLPRDLIEGIEVYKTPGAVPGQYRTFGDACGTVLVWTARGGRR